MTLTVKKRYQHSAERVYDAWLDPAKAGRFMFSTPTGQMVKVEIDARVGGKFLFVDRRDGQDVEHFGEYLELERPRRLAFSFAVTGFTEHHTRVVVDIEPADEGCLLTLTHEGVLPEFQEQGHKGWSMILDQVEKTL